MCGKLLCVDDRKLEWNQTVFCRYFLFSSSRICSRTETKSEKIKAEREKTQFDGAEYIEIIMFEKYTVFFSCRMHF